MVGPRGRGFEGGDRPGLAGVSVAEGDTPAWGVLRGLRAYRAAWEARAQTPVFEEGTGFPVRIQSEADIPARDPWKIAAWENPFARDGPAAPFWAGERMLEAEGSPTAAPLLPYLADAGARIDGLRLLDGTLIVKVEQVGRAVQIRVTGDGPLHAGGGLRLHYDAGPELPMEIARMTDLWSVLGGPVPRQGRVRWGRNGSF